MAAIPAFRRARYSSSYFNYECGSVDDEHYYFSAIEYDIDFIPF